MKRNQKWIPLVCVLAAVMTLLAVVALVLSGGEKPQQPQETSKPNQTTVGTSPVTESTGDQTENTDPLEDLVIETPFCELVYPGQWRRHLEVEQVAGTEHDVNFYASFEGMERIFLFSITFSPEKDDASAVIEDADGNDVGVYLHVAEVTVQLSDERMNEVYAMQEIVNELMDQLG